MKRIVTLTLALIMALAVASPAMAFTGVEWEASVKDPVELSIKLVDVEAGYVSVNLTAPPSNRAYVRGEMVCAVVSMTLSKDVDPSDGYSELAFSGKNVSVWQDENFRAASYGANTVTAYGGGKGMLNYLSRNAYDKLRTAPDGMPFFYADNMAVDNEIYLPESSLALLEATSNQMYHFAFFGRVLADGATMNATLRGAFELENGYWNDIGDYEVLYWNTNKVSGSSAKSWVDEATTDELAMLGGSAATYTYNTTDELPAAALVSDGKVGYFVKFEKTQDYDNDYVFMVLTDKNFKCEAMYVFDPEQSRLEDIVDGDTDSMNAAVAFEVYSTSSNRDIVFRPTTAAAASTPVTPLSSYVEQLLLVNSNSLTKDSTNVDDSSRTIYRALLSRLNDVVKGVFKLDPAYANGMLKPSWWLGNAEVFVEVAVEPWYAEVTVPPEIEVEPPKTGDAIGMLSFVLIALAGLAVVAVRKVRA